MRPLLARARLRRWADVVIPLGVGLFVGMIGIGEQPDGRPGWLKLLGGLLGLAQGLALVWRRTRPVEVTAATLAGGLGIQLLAPDGMFPWAALFALGSLAAARPPRVSLAGLAGVVALTAVDFATAAAADTWFAMVIAVVPWALGEAVRNRRVAVEEGARRAVTEERARIAREMHDVIAHSVSVIVVQAGAARDVFDHRPDQAKAALRSIETAGRDALGELRRMLAVVRPVPAGRRPEPEPARPAPGLARVEELAAPLRAAGLQVAIRREGSERPLPAGVDLSAYRIVQEALTNTLRHARATRAEVTVRYDEEAIAVRVDDDGAPAEVPAAGAGLGIAGMRERAALVGGRLAAGPRPGGGGFRVEATLPAEPAR